MKANSLQKDIHDIALKSPKEVKIVVAIEEMSELTKELCKDIRGDARKESILEELSDVELMLEQLCYIYGFQRHEINAYKKYKVERQKARYEHECNGL